MLDRSVSGRHVEIYLAVAGPCSNVPGEDLNSEPAQSSFSRWKDIMIPGHIDEWRAVELRKQNRLAEARDVLLSFHGRHAGNAESYQNVTVRSAIMALDGLPGVSALAGKLWPSMPPRRRWLRGGLSRVDRPLALLLGAPWDHALDDPPLCGHAGRVHSGRSVLPWQDLA